MDFVFADFAILQLADQGGGAEGNFVETILAMHDQHALGAEALHDAHQDADQIGVENAHQRVGRAGRIGQRAEDVEQGAHPHLAAHRRHVLHGAVMVGREHEAEAGFRDTGGNLFRRQHDVGAERSPARRPHRNWRTRCARRAWPPCRRPQRRQGRGRGDVEGVRRIAAGTDDVDKCLS
jgi:hypothetical protein